VTTALAVAGTSLAVLALAVSLLALRRTASSTRRSRAVPPDLEAVARAATDLRVDMTRALRHLAVVRYDAFGDMGGHLSWSLALADDAGHGVVLTSIHGRSEARTYAKSISAWSCEQQLSPEEEEAIEHARPSR
jgi:hypothetical protein